MELLYSYHLNNRYAESTFKKHCMNLETNITDIAIDYVLERSTDLATFNN